jgi:hypothetical protein
MIPVMGFAKDTRPLGAAAQPGALKREAAALHGSGKDVIGDLAKHIAGVDMDGIYRPAFFARAPIVFIAGAIIAAGYSEGLAGKEDAKAEREQGAKERERGHNKRGKKTGEMKVRRRRGGGGAQRCTRAVRIGKGAPTQRVRTLRSPP